MRIEAAPAMAGTVVQNLAEANPEGAAEMAAAMAEASPNVAATVAGAIAEAAPEQAAEAATAMAELNPDAAGAIVDTNTPLRASNAGLERPEYYLGSNDSYSFFSALGDLICIGPTSTNVGDLQVALIS